VSDSSFTTAENRPHRWYDRDPALARALESLRLAPSRFHAQVSLNMIKILVEHDIEADNQGGPDDVVVERLAEAIERAKTLEEHTQRRRWYDVNETLRSAMLLLEDMPESLQDELIPSIAQTIEDTLQVLR
jgi:hypothetical protein